jgi:hypothetical protein
MIQIANYFKMYTTYQFIAVLLVVFYPTLFPEELIDIIRGSCVIIGSIIAYFYYHFGYNGVMNTYAKMFPHYPKKLQPVLFPLVDFIVHYLVIFLIGLPRNPMSILYAAAIFITWFEANKDIIPNIYPFDFTRAEYEYIEYNIFPIIIVFLILVTYILTNKKFLI